MNITEGTAKMVRDAIEVAHDSISGTAAKAGIPYTTFHRKVNGAHPGFTVTELGNIANTLGVRVIDLIPMEDAA